MRDRNGIPFFLDCHVVYAAPEKRELPKNGNNRIYYEDIIVPKIGIVRGLADEGKEIIVQVESVKPENFFRTFKPYELLVYPNHWNDE